VRADAPVTLEFVFPDANAAEQFWPALGQLSSESQAETRGNHAVVTTSADHAAQVVQVARRFGGTQAAKLTPAAKRGAAPPPPVAEHKKCPTGSHWDGTKCVQVPGLAQWGTYAGGTGAAEGKHGHDIQMAHGKYSISPVASKHGRHLGYVANFAHHHPQGATAVPRHLAPGLHTRLTAEGGPDPMFGHVFRKKHEALAAVRKHFDRVMTEPEKP
jgi:hypothetical protein